MEHLIGCTVTLVSLIINLQRCHGNTEVCLTVPRAVDNCYAQSFIHPISRKSAKIDCLQRNVWSYEPDQNLTSDDRGYFTSLSRSAWVIPVPKTGYRTRKEYRSLTDGERHRLHRAFSALYKKGLLTKYADLHYHAAGTAHGGAAFLAWHRVFLAIFEDELRLEDHTVTLPYWDVTLDDDIDNPVNSIIWSRDFLGNGYGDVTTGPFAGWKTPRGNLWREYASHQRGKLSSFDTIIKILTQCRTNDVVYPLRNPDDEVEEERLIEFHQNGVHNWVGGDMSDKRFAAFDPAFYMLHAFADYTWELFRKRQKTLCGVDPETDYPTQTGRSGHGPNDSMLGFDGFKNIDGFRNYWTESWYSYENSPKCPECGSKYMYCDRIKNRCVSHSRHNHLKIGQNVQNAFIDSSDLLAEPKTLLIPKRIFNPFIPAPLRDGRTREAAKRDAKLAALNHHLDVPVESAFKIRHQVTRRPIAKIVTNTSHVIVPDINSRASNSRNSLVNRHFGPNTFNINAAADQILSQIQIHTKSPKYINRLSLFRSGLQHGRTRNKQHPTLSRIRQNRQSPFTLFRSQEQTTNTINQNPAFTRRVNVTLQHQAAQVNQIRLQDPIIIQNPSPINKNIHRRRKYISLVSV